MRSGGHCGLGRCHIHGNRKVHDRLSYTIFVVFNHKEGSYITKIFGKHLKISRIKNN